MMPSQTNSAQIAPLKPGKPLRDCPRWPTMQWLPHEPVEILDTALGMLGGKGFTTTRVEAVCALVLDCSPKDPSLLDDLRSYKTRHRSIRRSRIELRGVPLMLRMPSPITLRLDLLVEIISLETQRVYRHELVGTLITRGRDDLARLEEACGVYRQAKARQAKVSGRSLGLVLSQERPSPGARAF